MKQFKKVIGWIGTIIGAPFYFLDKAANFYGKKKFIEISMILVMGVFVWAFIYNMKGEKITASYFFIGIPLYIIGWCIVGGAIVLAQGIIIAGIVFVCIPGSMLYEVCAPLRMEPLQYAEWLQKKEEHESKSDYDEYVKKLKKSAENQQKIEQEAAQRQREQDIYQEAYKRAYSEGFYRAKTENTNSGTQNSTNASHQNLSKYEQARAMFMLEEGFTGSDLKKQYHRLLKVYHPDAGESDDEFVKKITTAYNILKPYAK